MRLTFTRRYGMLGEVTQKQIDAHKNAGVSKHEWAFRGQYDGYSEERCRICNKRRFINDRSGRPFQR